MATVFHILLRRAGIHQADQACQRVTYHTSGIVPALTSFNLRATLYGRCRRENDAKVGINIWPEGEAMFTLNQIIYVGVINKVSKVSLLCVYANKSVLF